MDFAAETSRRARAGGFLLTAFAAAMLIGFALGPMLVLFHSFANVHLVQAAFQLGRLP